MKRNYFFALWIALTGIYFLFPALSHILFQSRIDSENKNVFFYLYYGVVSFPLDLVFLKKYDEVLDAHALTYLLMVATNALTLTFIISGIVKYVNRNRDPREKESPGDVL